MPRFTYSDWVGRHARVERRLSSRSGEIVYLEGELVMIAGYDSRLRFSITNLKRENQSFMWGVEPRKLALTDHEGASLREKIFTHLLRSNAFGEVWVGAPDIARAIGEGLPSVSSVLKMMADDQFIRRRAGEGKRKGYGYRPLERQLNLLTRYDKLMSDQDILST